jgi:AcrR family transcriptional regulator
VEKIDRRIRRTHKLLQEALIQLTLEKGYESVTIRDITERADVGYATFFRHYPDKEALLAAVLRSMKEDFQVLLAPHSIVSNSEKTGTLVFQYVADNRDLCKVLLDSTDIMSLLKPVQDMGLQEIGQMFGASNKHSIPIEVAAYHLIMSLIMLIRWWLDNDMPYTPDLMGEIAATLIIRPVIDAMYTSRASLVPRLIDAKAASES